MRTCYTCRRRRLICDGGSPHCKKCEFNGVKCLGYIKPLTWIGGAATKGHLKQLSNSTAGLAVSGVCKNNLPASQAIPSPPLALTEPIFQDLSPESRFLVDYFEKRICHVLVLVDTERNPYRSLLSFIGPSRGVLHAVSAISACHMVHSITGVPVLSMPQDGTAKLSEVSQGSSSISHSTLAVSGLLKSLFQSKHRALRCLYDALSNPQEGHECSTLTTAILLVALDIWESGTRSWNVHLEGAKKLLESWAESGQLESVNLRMLTGLITLETCGSTLMLPGGLKTPLRSLLADIPIRDAPDTSIVGCPYEIASAIEIVTCQRQMYTSARSDSDQATQPKDADVKVLLQTLQDLEKFDIDHWGHEMVQASSHHLSLSLSDLMHVGRIWKLAAIIYAQRIYSNATMQFASPQSLVNDIIAEYISVQHLDDATKILMWPAFIAGAESTTTRQRQYVLHILDRIWQITLSANAKNAALTLQQYWKQRESQTDAWNWTNETSLLNDYWLFF
ncbi:hypothetical protein EJ05DRAFT_505034 [Pseudovirgaria hyperparasitica]|uniref:Zn(2)-C6 fungal-type domain-containing protein n=1 Tax=Pseudovirgaria hyperparasitica TaxID=470096 RepID=A0A6A6VT43_9PEZI|nr:uncharacterized protein EJ05DRAFT_505034 [Pseudovirgaria hyperparasitica]KAF2753393.1 hypothetical protein EJ05DRAFT_505034 [Pseudovirgaria hyperparasitica]